MRSRPSRWLASVMNGLIDKPDHSFPEPEQWNGSDPGREPLPAVYYRCLAPGCDWAGHGRGAYDHHFASQPHHPIILRDMPQIGPISFPCCPRQTREDIAT